MKQSLLIYILVAAVFGFGIAVSLECGRRLPSPISEKGSTLLTNPKGGAASPMLADKADSLWATIRRNLQEPLARLFLQIIIVLLATRAVGRLFVKWGQPSVIGEMAAGILLGPSMFGWLAPEAFQFVFQSVSLPALYAISQIGVCLYMFVVGMELDLNHVRSRAYTAMLVSHTGILFPFFLGVLGSLVLYSSYAAPGVSFEAFALFMGIAMSITAFPVLARILEERGLSKTVLGVTAITCAAVDDATAWSVLAVIVTIVHASSVATTLLSLALAALFVALMLCLVRPRLSRWMSLDGLKGGISDKVMIGSVLIFLLASALTTEAIGLHAIFGSFLAGVVMPARPEFRQHITVRIEAFSSICLLPLFFAFTGLRTQMGLLNDATGWLVCLGIIAIATLGKLGGSMLAARVTGMNWGDSFRLGALMNTRGLMELIALNLGYDFGILPPRIFTMMVLMALITTFLTGPLLTLAKPREGRKVIS